MRCQCWRTWFHNAMPVEMPVSERRLVVVLSLLQLQHMIHAKKKRDECIAGRASIDHVHFYEEQASRIQFEIFRPAEFVESHFSSVRDWEVENAEEDGREMTQKKSRVKVSIFLKI